MDTPTKVLTVGIGALAAVAAYLGWQNVQETPEIIDSDVHDYDSKVPNSKVAGAFSKTIEDSDEETEKVVEQEDNKVETSVEQEASEEKVKELAQMEVKNHIDKQQSTWGQFWKSEYNDIQKNEIADN
jgi:hypothetical protein